MYGKKTKRNPPFAEEKREKKTKRGKEKRTMRERKEEEAGRTGGGGTDNAVVNETAARRSQKKKTAEDTRVYVSIIMHSFPLSVSVSKKRTMTNQKSFSHSCITNRFFSQITDSTGWSGEKSLRKGSGRKAQVRTAKKEGVNMMRKQCVESGIDIERQTKQRGNRELGKQHCVQEGEQI